VTKRKHGSSDRKSMVILLDVNVYATNTSQTPNVAILIAGLIVLVILVRLLKWRSHAGEVTVKIQPPTRHARQHFWLGGPLKIIVNNATNSLLTTEVSVLISGPDGYTVTDTLPQKSLEPKSREIWEYVWTIPRNHGSYTLKVSLPNIPTANDSRTIHVA
jgi:hypothetical protein